MIGDIKGFQSFSFKDKKLQKYNTSFFVEISKYILSIIVVNIFFSFSFFNLSM